MIDTKERIIQASLELFLEQGFHATSMRDIAEKIDVAPGGLYNHFKEKDEIYQFIINKYHPWLLIPKIVKTAEGDTFDDFIKDASIKERKELQNNKKFMKLHFIEMVEFNGQHLPDLFLKAFNAMVEVLRKKQEQNPKVFKNQSITQLSRVFLGLFFSYMINDPEIMGSKNVQLPMVEFDYFNDIYLQGLISSALNNDEEK